MSAVGSGGKSTLLLELAQELSGRTILTTTTHMLVPEHIPYLENPDDKTIAEALEYERCICIGQSVQGTGGKICAPALPMERLRELADHVLVEADGSKRLPLKAHASWEPVIPARTDETIEVVGASGFGRPIAEAVHRSEIFCGLTGACPKDSATPALVAQAIAAECRSGICRPDLIVVNQTEGQEQKEAARAFAAALATCGIALPVFAGSIRAHELERLA
ncbi:MAG: selenium cofactor biosynthesis protein YqeC [Atopobiaceae bacterium]